ncbi:MAG: ankyrin repeat domain-containing protein [Wolbachia sp.]
MHGNNTGNGFSWATPEPLSESTKQLFEAIDDENLEDFKQAITEGADVNAFDEEGMTPLMSITNIYITSDNQPALKEIAKLLIQRRNIDINAQSKQVISEEQWRYTHDFQGIVSSGFRPTAYVRKDTALHIACQVGAKDIVKILLTHPDVKTGVENYEYKSPKNCIARGFEDTIKLEFEKAQKGKQLLNALSSIYLTKVLLDEELNPNCWERARSGEIETPLSLIIKSCLYTITKDREEVLTKLLKHKELDFSQIKSTSVLIEREQLKRIIKQAITERLIDTINKKDLDNVKELVGDNCFMDCAIVTAALRGVNDPIDSITNYLNEKFPASVEQPSANAHNVAPEINDELIVQELQQLESPNEPEGTKTQVTEEDVRHKRVENRNRVKRESNEPPPPNRKQNNYASAFFMLCGICAIGVCLTIEDYPEVSAYLAAVALILFLVGYFLYKEDEKDIGPSGITDNPQITRVLISSPNFAESSYTY